MYGVVLINLFLRINSKQIGQAFRTARAHGLDGTLARNHSPSSADPNHAKSLWIDICVLDQRLSAAIGASPEYLFTDQTNNLLRLETTGGSSSHSGLNFNLAIANSLVTVMTGSKRTPLTSKHPITL
jgi:hypothetical protein